MSKRIKKFLAISLVTGILSGMNVTAFASESSNKGGVTDKEITTNINSANSNKLSEKDKKELNTWMEKYKVDENTRNRLLDKLDKGYLWESITSPKSPVKKEKLDNCSIKKTYSDGSIIICGYENGTSVSNKTSNISLDSIDEGTGSGGSGYWNVTGSKIYYYGGTVNAEFYADYTFVNGGYDYISKIYKKHVLGLGCTVSAITLDMVQKREDANDPAHAQLNFIVTSLKGVASGNMDLDLYVGNNTANSDFND